MAQLMVEVIRARREGRAVELELLVNGRRLSREVTASKVDTPEKLAGWLVAQALPVNGIEQALRRRLVIDYHVEEAAGPIVDGVAVSRLVEEQAILDIEALPGWAGWSGNEAVDWIETNVTSLTTAKTAMKAMARMLVAQRDILKKVVERIGS